MAVSLSLILLILRSLWEGYTWNTDNAAALIFARLRPLSHNVSQPSAGLERLSPEHYRCLLSLFSRLSAVCARFVQLLTHIYGLSAL